MGQGVYTAVAMILADELDADFATVTLEHAPPNDKLYGNPIFGIQVTGNSNSIRSFWKPLRMAGARRGRCWCGRRRPMAGRSGKLLCVERQGHARCERARRGLRRSGRCGEQRSGAAESAAQRSERLHADRQAAQAARYAEQDQRQGRLRHRRHVAGDEVCDAGAVPGVRRQGRPCRRQRGEGRSGRTADRRARRSGRGCRRSHVGGQARPRCARSSPGTKGRMRRSVQPISGRTCATRAKRTASSPNRSATSPRVSRRATGSTANTSCRSWRTRPWSR